MLHLVNSIFVAIDEMVDTSQDRIVISRTHGNGMEPILDETSDGWLYGFSHAYDQIIGQGKQFPNLLAMLDFANNKSQQSKKQFIFYCDRQGFAQLVTNFHKALLPNANSSDIYRVIDCYQTRQRLKLFSYSNDLVVRDPADALDELSVTMADVDAAFASSTVRASEYTQFFKNNVSGLGLEYLLATYSRNGKNKLELSEIFKRFVIHSLVAHFTDTKDTIIDNIWDEDLRKILGIPNITVDTIEAELQNPARPVSVYFDRQLWRTVSNSAIFNLSGMFDKLTQQQINKLYQVFRQLQEEYEFAPVIDGNNDSDMVVYLNTIQNYINNINNPDWGDSLNQALNDDILKNPLIDKMHCTVNVYFLRHIINSHQSNKAGLTPYIVNGSF